MASLQAPASARESGIALNRLFSLLTFLVIFSTGWIALSYVKSELDGGERSFNQTGVEELTRGSIQSEKVISAAEAKPESPLVYSTAGDSTHFHTATHLPSKLERTALTEETARARGLKPCPVCMTRKK